MMDGQKGMRETYEPQRRLILDGMSRENVRATSGLFFALSSITSAMLLSFF